MDIRPNARQSQDRRDLLRALLRLRRGQLSREEIGLPPRTGRRGGLSLADLSEATGYSEKIIGQLEGGRLSRPSPELLTAISTTLRMTVEEVRALWLLAAQMSPPTAHYATTVDPGLAQLAHRQMPHPAYVTDAAWTVLAANDAVGDWFADPATLPRNNIAVWLLTDPHARHVFVDWERAARGFVAQLRAMWSRYPHDPALHDLVVYLRERSAVMSRWWIHDPTVYLMHATERRWFRRPGHTIADGVDERHQVPMDLTVLTPLTTGDDRRLTVFQLPDGEPRPPVASQAACPACQG